MGDDSDDIATALTSRAEGLSVSLRRASKDWAAVVEPPPLFLFSSFRTGSTWLWDKLRRAPTTFAYYEIFNEMLGHMTHAELKDTDYRKWNTRHPTTPPYFLAFTPLVKPDGGVAGYDSSMAYQGFVPKGGLDGPLADSERDYVHRLIAAARPHGRIPVLGCTRSLGRARALRRLLGHGGILLHRNLFHQWASYCSQAEAENSFFLDTIRWTIDASTHDPFLRGLATWFDVRDPSLPREELFQAFVLMHLYLLGFAFDACELVVNTTEIATDASARRRVERELSEMIRYPLDLSDARLVCELPDPGFVWSKTVRDMIEQFAKLIPETGRSADSVAFVEHAKDGALAEWERFEFFNRGTRSVLMARIRDLETQLAGQVALSDEVRSRTEGLVADMSKASSDAASEKQALTERIAVVETGARELEAQCASLSAARDTAVETATAAVARQEMLEQELASIRADQNSTLFARLLKNRPRQSA